VTPDVGDDPREWRWENLAQIKHHWCPGAPEGLVTGRLIDRPPRCNACHQEVNILVCDLGEVSRLVIRARDTAHAENVSQAFWDLGWGSYTFRAFDAEWIVPQVGHYGTMGDGLSILCERLQIEGLLGEHDGWATGCSTKEVGYHRPAFMKKVWESSEQYRSFLEHWYSVAPSIATAGAWSYYIPKDVIRFLPEPSLCACCLRPKIIAGSLSGRNTGMCVARGASF
jgi:hypothetical protein